MKHALGLVFASSLLAIVVACSTSDDVPTPSADPDAGAATDGGSRADTGTTSGEDAGGDADSSSSTVPSVDASDVCAASAKSVCAFLTTCAPEISQGFWADPATECAKRLEDDCNASYPAGARVRKDDADAYVACTAGLVCNDLYGPVWSTKCSTPRLANTKANGASCRIDAECMSGSCSGSSTKCGACVARVAAGAACTESAQCPAGGYCNDTCFVVAGLGQTCDANHLCGTGEKCDAAKCVKAGGEGAACSSDADCDLFALVQCNKTSGKCEKLMMLEPGDTCPAATSNGPPALCTKGSRCIRPQASDPGTCVAPAKVGEACGSDKPCETFVNCRGPSGQEKCVLPTYVSCP